MKDTSTLQKALYTIKMLKQLVAESQAKHSQPIAIVGVGCRYPEANNKSQYWDLLCSGKNVISPIPEQRWQLLKDTREKLLQEEASRCRGGFLQDIADFDAYFFGITPREAIRMDPQQRLILEVAYEAIEDAGLPVEKLAGSNTGVFTSVYSSQLTHLQCLEDELDALYIPTGNAVSMAANRLSYLYDLRGPSVILDTACSSSLVALNLACLHIQNKLCDTAFVCAANINLLPSLNLLLLKAKMLSPDGQCKTFDAAANGYVPGEGIGVVILKPLERALQDNDRIYAVIMGSAVNQDGKTNGLTAPNGLQQQALLKSAYKNANVNPLDISYIECHGTGTFLGDPIEVQALGNVVCQGRRADKPCWIGSVKTNIGHLEPAAGMASLIKVALALNNSQIPPHLNVHKPNPHIPFNQYHLRIPQQLEKWHNDGPYRLAGISGFGFGGTNAHAVVRSLTADEMQPTVDTVNNEPKAELFTLSAKDPVALKLLIERWCEYLKTTLHSLGKICYNTHLRRSHYHCRLAVICDSKESLLQSLLPLKAMHLEDKISIKNIFLNIGKEVIQFPSFHHELETLAAAYAKRELINWKEHEANRCYKHIDMPAYPWQHKTYWPELIKHSFTYPFQRKQIKSPLALKQFEFCFDTNVMPEIKDTYNFLHAGYYIEMIAIAVDKIYRRDFFIVENCQFTNPIYVANNSVLTVQLIIEINQSNTISFSFYSQSKHNEQSWTPHATGTLAIEPPIAILSTNMAELKNRCPESGTAEDFTTRIKATGMPAEGSIAWTSQYWFNDQEILSELREPESINKITKDIHSKFKLNIHPGIIDGCVQTSSMLLPKHLIKPFVAASIGKFTYYGLKHKPAFLTTTMKLIHSHEQSYTSDFSLLDATGNVLMKCENLSVALLNENVHLNRNVDSNIRDMHSPLLTQKKSKPLIVDYLMEQVAIIFSIPKQDINVNLSLRDMGLDSLMAIVLSSNIETGLGVTFSTQALLTGPSITDIAEFTLNGCAETNSVAPHNSNNNPWIAYKTTRKQPKLRLFCFPYGGGGASIYSAWHKDLPEEIEVCPIQLPGRENRMEEAPLDNMSSLIEALIANLRSELTVPFAFFGHSFGSLIAFELTRALRKHNLPQPLHIFASAFPDPRIPTKSLNNLITELQDTVNVNLFDLLHESSVSLLNDSTLQKLANIFSANGLVDYGKHMLNKEIIKVLLPIFIGDMSLVRNYKYVNENPLDLPITVFLGKQDGWVEYEDHLGWSDHSTNKCEFHEFDSGHLFIKEERIKKIVLNKIVNAISQDGSLEIAS